MEEKEPKAQAAEESTAVPAKVEAAGRYCPVCGRDVTDPPLFRFGEYFCSEAHVAELAAQVRARRAPTAAAAREVTPADATAEGLKKSGTWSLLKMGACCGGALLLLALIPFAAVGSSLLSLATLLACPLGMYFMMRGMQRMDHRGKTPAAGSPGTGGRARVPGGDAGQ